VPVMASIIGSENKHMNVDLICVLDAIIFLWMNKVQMGGSWFWEFIFVFNRLFKREYFWDNIFVFEILWSIEIIFIYL